jgi:hypothetical protein
MGQRFQAYLAITHDPGRGTGKIVEPRTAILGLHHQWLWGMTAMKQTLRLLKFIQEPKGEALPKTPFNPESFRHRIACCKGIFGSIFSLIPEDQYYHEAVVFEGEEEKECCANPCCGDNNNGILIVDARDVYNVRYCFMNIGHIECGQLDEPVLFTPFSGETWLDFHYPPDNLSDRVLPRCKKWLTEPDRTTILRQCEAYKREIASFPVLTLDEVKQLFPKMYEDQG